jgi:predicted RNase H-like HicB family nuclease
MPLRYLWSHIADVWFLLHPVDPDARRFSVALQWCDEDRIYIASCPEIPCLMTHSKWPWVAVRRLRYVIADVLQHDAEAGGIEQPRLAIDYSYFFKGERRHGTA